MKHNYFYQNKKIKSVYCFTFLQIFLMSSLIVHNWILRSVTSFRLLQCFCSVLLLVEIYEENPFSHVCVVGKGGVLSFSGKQDTL